MTNYIKYDNIYELRRSIINKSILSYELHDLEVRYMDEIQKIYESRVPERIRSIISKTSDIGLFRRVNLAALVKSEEDIVIDFIDYKIPILKKNSIILQDDFEGPGSDVYEVSMKYGLLLKGKKSELKFLERCVREIIVPNLKISIISEKFPKIGKIIQDFYDNNRK